MCTTSSRSSHSTKAPESDQHPNHSRVGHPLTNVLPPHVLSARVYCVSFPGHPPSARFALLHTYFRLFSLFWSACIPKQGTLMLLRTCLPVCIVIILGHISPYYKGGPDSVEIGQCRCAGFDPLPANPFSYVVLTNASMSRSNHSFVDHECF